MDEKRYCPRCRKYYATDRKTCPICGASLENENDGSDCDRNEDADDVVTIINAMMSI
jgi:RNA polymerase subunit RPABC4/transcription elongation factor Spt4